jgi:CheY-like chemotaxis protein
MDQSASSHFPLRPILTGLKIRLTPGSEATSLPVDVLWADDPNHVYEGVVWCAIKASRKCAPSRGVKRRLPLNILVAEDNIVNQKVAMAILVQFGYQPDLAVSGKEVVAAVARQKYDLIFMDLQMPEMDGLEATRIIYSQTSRPERPYIVALTANAMKEDRDLCLAAGMDDYLSKPMRPQEIKAVIERATEARQVGFVSKRP